MVKKKIKLDKEKLEDLQGFEDAIDLIGIEEVSDTKPDPRGAADTFELYNFLENEKNRLALIDIFLSQKIKNGKKYSQSNLLIDEANKNKEVLQGLIIPMIRDDDSNLNIKLRQLYNSSFNKVES